MYMKAAADQHHQNAERDVGGSSQLAKLERDGMLKSFQPKLVWDGRLKSFVKDGYRLGSEYESPDYATAVEWLRGLAEQGDDVTAQHNLGVCYAKGVGIQKNPVEAYMWFNVAAARGSGSGSRDSLLSSMTQKQIAEAQQRAAAFVAMRNSAKTK